MQKAHSFTLLEADNLYALQQFQDGNVDLIYMDPPYNTGKRWEVATGIHSRKQGFDDRFASAQAYVDFMAPRIQLARKALANTGSLVIQCDDHADFLIKGILIDVFGRTSLVDQITWQRSSPNTPTRGLPRNYGVQQETIFRACRDPKQATFNPVVRDDPTKEANRKNRYKYPTAAGIICRKDQLTAKGYQPTTTERGRPWHGLLPGPKRHWRWNRSVMDRMLANGDIVIGEGQPYSLTKPTKGPHVGSIWTGLTGKPRDPLSCPTEKPLPLLARILNSFSDPEDLVLDAFAGGGNVLVAAAIANRNYIGIEQNHAAIEVARARAIANRIPLKTGSA